MKKLLLTLALPLAVIACAPAPAPGPEEPSDIVVDSPLAMTVVRSPLTITGKAKGTWYFEASFPVKLFDSTGTLLVEVPAQAQGDWMTDDFVPFTATLVFKTTAKEGMLTLSKDNPSGMPENDKSIAIPVKF